MTAPNGDATYNVTYATSDDLKTWMGLDTAPANATVLLRSASMLVRDAISGAYYLTDTDGLPTEANVIAALRDATSVQAAAWSTLKIDPLAGGVITSGIKTSKGIGTANITYADAAQAAAARTAAADGLVPEAQRILNAEDLLQPRVWTYG
jgi:hypothetical protein